jgi:hypothetical protein
LRDTSSVKTVRGIHQLPLTGSEIGKSIPNSDRGSGFAPRRKIRGFAVEYALNESPSAPGDVNLQHINAAYCP